MKIAVDISPISESSTSQHKIRGVGKYITLLKENLEKYDKNNTYSFVSSAQNINNVDIIHYPYFDPYFISLPFIQKAPIVVTVHDIIQISHKKNFPAGFSGNLKWKVNKILLKRARAIITDSNASKDEISIHVGIDRKKIYPAYLSVDDKFRKLAEGSWMEEVKSKYALPDKFILYVGDVTWNKNLPRLIRSVLKLKYPLVMVGKAIVEKDYDANNGWNKDRIIVESLTKNNPSIIKLGFVPDEDLVRIYNLCHFLCMPSLDEGFGLPVLEALKCGCPALISREGSLPEVGGDGVEYTDAKNEDDITTKIKMLMEEPKLKEKWELKIKNQAEKFSLEKFINDTVSIYESIKP